MLPSLRLRDVAPAPDGRGSPMVHGSGTTEGTTSLLVGSAQLEFIEHPLYVDAHPGEPAAPGERCTQCAIVRRPDTGEHVLLWLVGAITWAISRHDPFYDRHRAELGS